MVLPRDDEARPESDEELRALVRLLGGSTETPLAPRAALPTEPLPPPAHEAEQRSRAAESPGRELLRPAREPVRAPLPPTELPLATTRPAATRPRVNGLTLAALAMTGLFAGLAWQLRASLARERAMNAAQVLAAEEASHDARARAVLERFLDLLEEGELAAAGHALAAARADETLAARGYGTGFLEAALEARRLLDASADQELRPRTRAESEARDALDSARAQREAFLAAAHRWLLLSGATRAAPRTELLRWFDNLEQELARRSAARPRASERSSPDLRSGAESRDRKD